MFVCASIVHRQPWKTRTQLFFVRLGFPSCFGLVHSFLFEFSPPREDCLEIRTDATVKSPWCKTSISVNMFVMRVLCVVCCAGYNEQYNEFD